MLRKLRQCRIARNSALLQNTNGHGKDAASDDEVRHARFPDETTSHSTSLSKDDNQVAGYLSNPLGETTRHLLGCMRPQPTLVIPQAGEVANESLREFHVNEALESAAFRRVPAFFRWRFFAATRVSAAALQWRHPHRFLSNASC